jgi:hypothetical protein
LCQDRDRRPPSEARRCPRRCCVTEALHHRDLGPTADGARRRRLPTFIVDAQQYELIGKRLHQVQQREGLWDQGVRFGANVDPETGEYVVLIKPGRSRLSARQILDRLLGIA